MLLLNLNTCNISTNKLKLSIHLLVNWYSLSPWMKYYVLRLTNIYICQLCISTSQIDHRVSYNVDCVWSDSISSAMNIDLGVLSSLIDNNATDHYMLVMSLYHCWLHNELTVTPDKWTATQQTQCIHVLIPKVI